MKVLEISGLWKSVGSVASGMTSEPGGSHGGSQGMGFEEDRLRLWSWSQRAPFSPEGGARFVL